MLAATHTSPELHSRFRGAFLGACLGDAFGRVFEGTSVSDLRQSSAIEQRARGEGPWGYSDDTEMLLAVAESLIDRGGFDAEHMLRTLALRCDPARGYGHGIRAVFQSLEHGTPWHRAAYATWPEGSRGNGAAVRVVPIACLYHHDAIALAQRARLSASITHAHPIARLGAQIHALAIAEVLARPGGTRPDAPLLLDRLCASLPAQDEGFTAQLERVRSLIARNAAPEEAAESLGNGVTADVSVPLALHGFLAHSGGFADVVTHAVRCGGDTDTIAAMSGALAGAFYGYAGLPARWIRNLENGPRGRDLVVQRADDVWEAWRRRAGGSPRASTE